MITEDLLPKHWKKTNTTFLIRFSRLFAELFDNITMAGDRNRFLIKQKEKVVQIAFLLFLLILTACYPEWKMSRSYIDSEPSIAILILPADYVFKKNLKIEEISDQDELNEWEQDSVLIANSLFLQDLSDSIFLETVVNSMLMEFEALGFTVYLENMLDSFLFVESPAYIFSIAQIELEEHYTVHKDQETFNDYIYYKNVDLNAISYNFWFELSELNDETENTKLLFASETINDVISGYFAKNMFSGEIKYKYNINELDMDIIYRYSDIFARRFAGYAYDYLMNAYLDENWPTNKKRRYYMRYNRDHNTLDPTWEDKFTIMEE